MEKMEGGERGSLPLGWALYLPEESMLGLQQSVEQGERFRELARTDTDLDPLRDEPEFQQIVG